jgi:hypothetical protein
MNEFADHTEDLLEFTEDQSYLGDWNNSWGPAYFGISNLDDCVEYNNSKTDLTPSEWLRELVTLNPNVKAIDFTCASITDGMLHEMVENLNGFSSLVVLNLSSNTIHSDVYEDLKQIIQQPQFRFINLQHTHFGEALIENFESFKTSMRADDFDLFMQKAIWLNSDPSIFDEEWKQIPFQYQEQVRNTYDVYKKMEGWLIHISSRKDARAELKDAIEIKKER